MSSTHPQLLVTGASGQLGRLVVDQLLATVPGGQIAAVGHGDDLNQKLIQAAGGPALLMQSRHKENGR